MITILMRINYEIWWIFGLWWVISYDVTIYFSSHGFLVLLQNSKAYSEGNSGTLNFFELVKAEGKHFSIKKHSSIRIMGDRRKRSKPMRCQELKEKLDIWEILVEGNSTGFM